MRVYVNFRVSDALYFERRNFADVIYAQTSTLHTILSSKSKILNNHPFKFPDDIRPNLNVCETGP